MTEKELKKEAEDYAEKHAFRVPYDGSNKFYDDVDFKASKEGYLAGAEPREKRISELEKENAELKQEKIPQLERKIANQDMTDKEMTEECTDRQKQDDELKEFTEEFEKEVEREKARVLRNFEMRYWR
jgi:chaperonin GroEL (HSP60 family)